jgi:hypothetical protein
VCDPAARAADGGALFALALLVAGSLLVLTLWRQLPFLSAFLGRRAANGR